MSAAFDTTSLRNKEWKTKHPSAGKFQESDIQAKRIEIECGTVKIICANPLVPQGNTFLFIDGKEYAFRDLKLDVGVDRALSLFLDLIPTPYEDWDKLPNTTIEQTDEPIVLKK